jgi:cephalosporin-C deacetylase
MVDLPEHQLRGYRSDQVDPPDFDEFWADTLAEARDFDLGVTRRRVDAGLTTVDVFDLEFAGFGGHPVRAWLRMPSRRDRPLPAIVQFLGYGAGRGHPLDDLVFSSAGYAHLVVDARGQGTGETADPVGSGPAVPGFMTRGIHSPEDYYYRRVFTDAVRAVEAARSLAEVDGERVAVVGASQGGGIALAMAGLVPNLAAVLVQAPFLCDFPRATMITDAYPYAEIAAFLKARRGDVATAHRTLAYFDGVNFAKRATAPGWFSTALMDGVCPPSTVFAAYNEYAAPRRIVVGAYNGHDAGGADDTASALRILRDAFVSTQ